MRYAARVDQNHRAIVDAMKQCGWTVDEMQHAGSGFPDLVATRAGVTLLVEVKTATGKLNARQRTFHSRHNVTVIRTINDVLGLGVVRETMRTRR